MRVLLVLGLVLASLPLRAQTLETTIESVISDQIDAMRNGDFETAFTFASPGIQSFFVSPENFQAMVETGYPMVKDPARLLFDTLEMRGGAMVQSVQIVDQSGRVYDMEYDLVPIGDRWVVNAVRILDSQMLGV